jgi:hypothetical protein
LPLRRDARSDHALRLDTGIEPAAELGDTLRAVARARDRDADLAQTFAAKLRAHVVAHARPVSRCQKVAAIEHDELLP